MGPIYRRIRYYKDIHKLFVILKESKSNSTDTLSKLICNSSALCRNYLNSSHNIFSSGVDLGFETGIKEISNSYLEYSKLKNQTDIEEIKNTFIYSPNSHFEGIDLGLSHFFIYIQQRIFHTFESDLKNINVDFKETLTILNIFCIIISIIIFWFIVLYSFMSISNYTEPIKASAYRICYSFYYIKKYNIWSSVSISNISII